MAAGNGNIVKGIHFFHDHNISPFQIRLGIVIRPLVIILKAIPVLTDMSIAIQIQPVHTGAT